MPLQTGLGLTLAAGEVGTAFIVTTVETTEVVPHPLVAESEYIPPLEPPAESVGLSKVELKLPGPDQE